MAALKVPVVLLATLFALACGAFSSAAAGVQQQRRRLPLAPTRRLGCSLICGADGEERSVPVECRAWCRRRVNRSLPSEKETIAYTGTQACEPWTCDGGGGGDGGGHVAPCREAPGRPVDVRVAPVDVRKLVDIASDALVLTWRPNPSGVEALRGYQVNLQGLRGDFGYSKCEQILLENPLTAADVDKEFVYDGFDYLQFGADYYITVDPVPFPASGEREFAAVEFTARSCEEVVGKGNNECMYDWFPKTVNVTQQGTDVNVTFDLAPPSFGVESYVVYAGVRPEACAAPSPPLGAALLACSPVSENKTAVRVPKDKNFTYGWVSLRNLQPGATYVIEVSLNSVDAQRKRAIFTVTHVSPPSPWSGPLRAIAITVPIVAAAAVATFLTLVCRSNTQAEGGYHEFTDDESSEVCSQFVGAVGERSRPKIFLCYSGRDGQKHTSAVLHLAHFLQECAGCRVSVDLWEQLIISAEGKLDWLGRQINESDFILVVCSKGLKFFVDKRRRHRGAGGAHAGRGARRRSGQGLADLFIAAVPMIAEHLRRQRAPAGGADGERAGAGDRVLGVYFDYSSEQDAPAVLELPGAKFRLPEALPQLVERLHAGRDGEAAAAATPQERRRRLDAEGLLRSAAAGRALADAVADVHSYIRQTPDWFQRQCTPPRAPGHVDATRPPPPPSSAASEREEEGAAAGAVGWSHRRRGRDGMERISSERGCVQAPRAACGRATRGYGSGRAAARSGGGACGGGGTTSVVVGGGGGCRARAGGLLSVPVIRHAPRAEDRDEDDDGSDAGAKERHAGLGSAEARGGEAALASLLLLPRRDACGSPDRQALRLLRDSGIYEAPPSLTRGASLPSLAQGPSLPPLPPLPPLQHESALPLLTPEPGETDSTTGSISSSSGLGEEDPPIPRLLKQQQQPPPLKGSASEWEKLRLDMSAPSLSIAQQS
uniref:Interleukin-17 receptor D n=1 Tax=Petromyzon marinus TaxID=7757 RepID=A0AAJ7X605_PETMA|nr:interleukin-17 receptor D [Petromyzon marinus]